VPHEAIIVIGEIKRVNSELNKMFRLLALLDSRSDSTHLLNVALRLTTRSGPTLILTFGPTSLIGMPVRFGKVLAVPARMGCRGRNGV
jgi:hypothetical protein